MQKILTLSLVLSLLHFSCIKDKNHPEEIVDHVHVNDSLPAFTVKDTTGNEFDSRELSGHVALLVFFVSTCSDCARELPKVEFAWKSLKDNPRFRLVAISREETIPAVSEYWKTQAFSMPFYLDPNRETFSLFASGTVPRVYLINPEGTVTWMAIETLALTAGQLLEKIHDLLDDQPTQPFTAACTRRSR